MTPHRWTLGEWFASTAHDGSHAAGDPGGAGRRPGLLLLTLRRAVAPGLPLLHHRAPGGRPRRRATRADARRLAALRARLLLRLRLLRRADGVPSATGCSPTSTRSRWSSGSSWILLGLVFLGRGAVDAARRAHPPRAGGRTGRGAAARGAVGFGWTPCIGPTLSAVTSLALNEASAGRGALLSFVDCLGLGIPFVAGGAGLPAKCSARSAGYDATSSGSLRSAG